MIKISSILLCILFATALHAQGGYWQQLNGPAGGYSEDMVAGSDGTIYLATYEELWKRSPQDAGWEKVGPLPFYLGSPVVPQPLFMAFGRLFLLTDGSPGTCLSLDGGHSWKPTNTEIISMTAFQNILYAVSDETILRSTDSGFTWNAILDDTTNFDFTSISASPNGRIYAAGAGVYINVQGDSVWQKQTIAGAYKWGFVLAFNNNFCILDTKASYGTNDCRTTDGGMTWDSISRGWYYPVAKDSSGTLWTINGNPSGGPVIVSYDTGVTWTDGNFSGQVEGSFCVSPTNDIYLRTNKHIYHYLRNTQQWVLWEDSLYIGDIFGVLALSDDTIVVASDQGFSRTADGGQSWNLDSMDIGVTNGGLPSLGGYYLPVTLMKDREGFLYCGPSKYDPENHEWTYQQDTVEVELNGKHFGEQFDAQVLAVDSSDYLYSPAPTQTRGVSALLRSSDHGNSWQILSQSTASWSHMTVDATGRIIAAFGNSLVKSTDNGGTWDTLANNISGELVVTQNGTILIAADNAMMESTDDGVTWVLNQQFIPWGFALDGINKVYVVGVASQIEPLMGVLLSTDTGKTGELISSSLSFDTGFAAVAVSPNHTLYAGTIEDGLFRYIPSSSRVETAGSASANFTIFPNPATDKIQITSSVGNISILDPLGRSYEVKQSGNSIDVSSLPSGVYFVSDGQSRAKFIKQ